MPLAIDDPAPTFSWRLEAEGARGAKAACTLAVKPAAPGGELEEVLSAPGNATQFVPLPAGLTLKTDTEYSWTVTCGAASATSSFSTGLLSPSDWGGADWIGGSEKAAVLMRKKLTIEGAVTRARIFVAVPGYGQVSVNRVDVDGRSTWHFESFEDQRYIHPTASNVFWLAFLRAAPVLVTWLTSVGRYGSFHR